MFIAHLPAAYLGMRALLKKLELRRSDTRLLMSAGLVAAVLPDLDLFYFYLIDQRQHVHHSYWTHIPAFWASIGLVCALTASLLQDRALKWLTWTVMLNIFLHLLLDSVASKIYWLYPFSEQSYGLLQIPSVHSYWVLNYLLHWSFALELLICLAALYHYLKDRRNLKSGGRKPRAEVERPRPAFKSGASRCAPHHETQVRHSVFIERV